MVCTEIMSELVRGDQSSFERGQRVRPIHVRGETAVLVHFSRETSWHRAYPTNGEMFVRYVRKSNNTMAEILRR